MNHLLSALSRICLVSLLASSPSLAQQKDVPHSTIPNDNIDTTLTKFTYGSCCKHGLKMDHWPVIASNKPQFWLWLGDNIYGDSSDMKVLEKKYNDLGNDPGYIQLKKTCPVLATWDDHDYGKNDAGADFEMREESQCVFLNFFNERKDSARWKRPGVYTSYYFGKGDKRVQLILLDTRYFRTALKKIDGRPPYRPMGKYTPDSSPDANMLGDAQWEWLEQELKQPARIRFIGTSIQFCAPHNGFETWANMPLQQQRVIDLIKSTHAEGVVFLSGDIHGAEMCVMEPEGCYPLYDFTSSSLNLPLGAAKTRRRTGPGYGGRNFSLVEIDWNSPDPVIQLAIKDMRNATRLQHRIPLSKLTFDEKNLTWQSKTEDFAGEWQTTYGPLTLTHNGKGKWSGKCADRTLTLEEGQFGLIGTWQGKNARGKVAFTLSRDGKFLNGAQSEDDLPLQLDWAGWKAGWEKHFKRDDYKKR